MLVLECVTRALLGRAGSLTGGYGKELLRRRSFPLVHESLNQEGSLYRGCDEGKNLEEMFWARIFFVDSAHCIVLIKAML